MAKEVLSGLSICGEQVCWDRGEAHGGGWRNLGSGHLTLPDAEAEDADRSSVWREVLKRCGHTVTLVLPPDAVLLRPVDLPTVEDEEIEEMLDLQLDQFLPLPAEEMVVSYQEMSRRADGTLIMVAAAPRSGVEQKIAALERAGATVVRVVPAVLGWVEALRQGGAVAESGRQVVLVLGDPPFLMVIESGQLLLMKRVALDDLDALERDCGSALMSVELSHGHQSVVKADLVRVGEDAPAAGVADALCEACGVAVSEIPASDLMGPVAGALARDEDGNPIDLYPSDWRADAARKQMRKRKILGFSLAGVFWLAAMAALILFPKMQERKGVALQEQLEVVKTEADEVREIDRRIEMIRRYQDRSRSALETLLAINKARPDSVTLRTFTYDYGHKVQIQGEAGAPQPIYQFKNGIDKVDIFEDSTLVSQRRLSNGKERFDIQIELPAARRGEEAEE